MDGRLVTRRLDDQSCTDRPASGAPVGLATIPDTVTLSLGFAIVGVIDVIAIHARARAVLLLTAATAGPAAAADTPCRNAIADRRLPFTRRSEGGRGRWAGPWLRACPPISTSLPR